MSKGDNNAARPSGQNPVGQCAYWIISERHENWLVDQESGFTHFGLPHRYLKTAALIRPGDKILTYVSSKIASFADVREAADKPMAKPHRDIDYDTGYPIAIQTLPLLVLPREAWVPFKGLAPQLSFSAGKDYRQQFRATLRRVPLEDGKIIEESIRFAGRKTLKRIN